MAVKVLREEIVDYGDEELFEIETWGELKYMPRGVGEVTAIFGGFKRTDHGTLLYQTSVYRDMGQTEAQLLNSLDSEYLDDFNRLKSGQVEIEEW